LLPRKIFPALDSKYIQTYFRCFLVFAVQTVFFGGGKCKAVLADVDPVSQGGVLKVLGILGAESCGKLSQSVSG